MDREPQVLAGLPGARQEDSQHRAVFPGLDGLAFDPQVQDLQTALIRGRREDLSRILDR